MNADQLLSVSTGLVHNSVTATMALTQNTEEPNLFTIALAVAINGEVYRADMPKICIQDLTFLDDAKKQLTYMLHEAVDKCVGQSVSTQDALCAIRDWIKTGVAPI